MDQLGRRHMNSPTTDSRIQRLISVEEVLLEYSLVVIVLACFFLVSLSSRLFSEEDIAYEDGLWVKRL